MNSMECGLERLVVLQSLEDASCFFELSYWPANQKGRYVIYLVLMKLAWWFLRYSQCRGNFESKYFPVAYCPKGAAEEGKTPN